MPMKFCVSYRRNMYVADAHALRIMITILKPNRVVLLLVKAVVFASVCVCARCDWMELFLEKT